MRSHPRDLPVYAQKNRILEALQNHQVIVVESPTGSGKTTQLPIILHEAGYAQNGIIGITQPRRIAAVGVCRFIARQLQVDVGGTVGYKMRFEDQTSSDTEIKILTDGTLLQEMKGDRWLSRYSVLMIDEAHERTLNIDFILGLIKEVLPHRPELKIIISSATLNAAVFRQFFTEAPIVTIDTPIYPVDVLYDPPPVENDEDMLISKIASTVEALITKNPEGDILIFCTGEKMIKETVTKLMSGKHRRQLHVMPLYGRLGSEEQEKVFDPAPKGLIKVVVATNVAETSITIDGITAVIDTGLAKLNFYNPRTFTSALVETKISQASANQRKGRAGRTQAGTCYRLYPEDGFGDRDAYTKEEIYRTDLAEVVLRMAEIGIRDFDAFPFISPPSAKGLHGAIEALHLLDALDDENGLTDIGKRMTPYPLMPRHARMIVEATLRYPSVLREVIIASAFLSTNSPFLLPQGEEMEARKAHHSFRSERYGDFASYLNLYWDFLESKDKEAFASRYYLDVKVLNEILAIVEQLEDITSRDGVPITEGGPTEDFLKACARGLLPFVCVKAGRFDYRSVAMDRIIIHPGSVLFRENPDFIMAGEIVHTSRTYARSVSPLHKAWLADIHPELPGRLLAKNSEKRESTQRKEPERPRKDTTDQIWIGGISFPLSRSSGKGNKKRALFEWKALRQALANAKDLPLPDFGSLRGTLLLDRDEVLPDSKVMTILKAVSILDPKKDVHEAPPRGNFHIHKSNHRQRLISELSALLTVTRGSKKQKRGGMGFTALYSDGEGHYWFKAIKSFHGAISVSLESLEDLADQLDDAHDESELKTLGKAYRRIEGLLY
ncbi:MAG: ATP-dependent RNA helicase [Spirochaetales bacterium]|nr:ATP-dependent RNA helicase [Spirochaetales bacterium]